MPAGKLAFWIVLLIGLTLAMPFRVSGGEADESFAGIRGRKPVRSLMEIREAHTIRQRWDNSCGSAALATILTHHYGDRTPEAVIITSILRIANPIKIRNQGGFSLFDLKRFVESRGYEGKGYAGLSLEELTGFGVPAIVPIQSRGYDHFVVFRGIRGNRVVLSDPSFGTVTMKVARFTGMWKGGIGFIVLRRGAAQSAKGLEPKSEEFLIPAGGGIGRASAMGPTPLTRR